MFEWFKSKIKDDFIEVMDEKYNPLQELISSYKDQIIALRENTKELAKENQELRMTIIDLNTKLNSAPRVSIPQNKHFTTVSGLQHELEARSRKKMLEEKGVEGK